MTPSELARECAETSDVFRFWFVGGPMNGEWRTLAGDCVKYIYPGVTKQHEYTKIGIMFFYEDCVPSILSAIEAAMQAQATELTALRTLADAVAEEIGDDYPHFAMQAALTAARQAQGVTT